MIFKKQDWLAGLLLLMSVWQFQAQAQNTFYNTLADSALTLTHDSVVYDPGYFSIDYPNGDVPEHKGVCTDVVIRAYRKLGIDLQLKVHEDMQKHFEKYPKNWGLRKPDKNIDHRRVPNLRVFIARHGNTLDVSDDPATYKPGEIVTWDLGGGLTHIGIVSCVKSTDQKRFLIIHNIGAGQVLQDCLFNYTITGHYQYSGN